MSNDPDDIFGDDFLEDLFGDKDEAPETRTVGQEPASSGGSDDGVGGSSSTNSDDRSTTPNPDDTSDDTSDADPDGTDAELDQPEVDARFAELVGNYSAEAEVIATASALMEAEYILNQAEAERAKFEKLYNELNEQRIYHEGEARRLAAEMAKLRVDSHEVISATSDAERKVKEAEKKHQISLQSVQYKEEVARTNSELDEVASQFPWFTGLPNGYKIKPYQLEGAKFLATSKRAILGDTMGLGKTVTAIAAMDLAKSKRVLIIAPADITSNFDDEVRTWASHRVVINIRGMSKADRDMALNTMMTFMTDFVVVVNYEAWRKDFSLLNTFGNIGFDTVILDEAHTLKKLSGNAAEGARDFIMANNVCPICDDGQLMPIKRGGSSIKGGNNFRQCEDCGYQAGASFDAFDFAGQQVDYKIKTWMTKSVKNVWFMTGTPILNQPADIFPLLNIIDPFNFEFKNEFLRMFCTQDYNGRWGFLPGGERRLMQGHLHGRYLARDYSDAGIELPEQRMVRHRLEVREDNYPKQREVIDMLNEHASIVLDDGRALKNMEIIALLTRQRQANVWPGGIEAKDPLTGEVIFKVSEEITEAIKLDKAIDIILEAKQTGERVVVFSQFTKALDELNDRLNLLSNPDNPEEPIRSVKYTGSTPQDLRLEIKTNFDAKKKEEAKWDVVCANYKSGGTGLNLTATTQTIILDQEWNPGKRDQAYGRNHRIGQEHETMVHILEVEDTVDQWLDGIMEQKQEMLEGFTSSAVDMQDSYLAAIKKGMGK